MALIFKHDRMPALVMNTLLDLGWVEFDEKIHEEDEWNIYWKPTRPTMGEYSAGRPYQKLIHFPKTGILCTKDNLARLIKRNRGWFGKIYHFTPVTYVLPNETKQFVDLFTRQAVSTNQKQQMWICKPTDLSRGRKISIINNLQDLQYDQQSVIQEYIDNPLLIRGTKWDMRIYVLITQMRPLKVHLFKEGIARFSSERYNTNDIQNVFSHLTNSSINKYAATNVSDGNASGLKWSFAQLKNYFGSCGYDYDMMWVQIEQIIQLTCINLCTLVPDLKCCFELLGFDVMLDANMKPWLLEVNSSPAMSLDCEIDQIVKPALIRDAINLCPFETYKDFQEKTRSQQTTKTSNIHQNFFSKRTTATSKREEGTGPNSTTTSTSMHPKKSLIQASLVKDKYDSRTSAKTYKQTSNSQPNSSYNHMSKGHLLNSNQMDSIEATPKAAYNSVACDVNVGSASESQLAFIQGRDHTSSSRLGHKKSKQIDSGQVSIASSQIGTTKARTSSEYAELLRSNTHEHNEDEMQRNLLLDGDVAGQDEERKSFEDNNSCEYSNTDTPILNMGSLASRKRSKNLIGSYSTTTGSKSTATSTSAQLKYGRQRKPSQFENVLPKVNTGTRQSSNAAAGLQRTANQAESGMSASLQPPSLESTGRYIIQSGKASRGESESNLGTSSRNPANASRDAYATRNRTTDFNRKAPAAVGYKTNNKHASSSGYGSSYNPLNQVVEHNLKTAVNEAKQAPMTEEQIEQDKVKRQARLKQQQDQISRLSVKRSALSKMLEAQKRKERIINPPKADPANIDRESGSLFRGLGGRNNRSSRLENGSNGANNQNSNQGANGGRGGPKTIRIPDNYQLPPYGKFKRETSGQFELIFPINQKTEELAYALNRQVGARASMGAPNFMKMLVAEIKQHNEEHMLFVKSGFRYAPP